MFSSQEPVAASDHQNIEPKRAFPGNGDKLSLVWCFKHSSQISSNMYIKHIVFKRQLTPWVKVKFLTNVSVML